MSEEELPIGAGGETLERHSSLDDRFDPAIRIVDYDPAWPVLAAEERRRLEEALDEVLCVWSTSVQRPCRVSPPSPSSICSSRSQP